jgi:transcriptional regulator with XRE-family HTH domain
MPPHNAHAELLDGKRIRRLRHARGYSVRRLARHLGVSATTITNLELGLNHAEVALRLVTDLARLLGVEPGELFPRPVDQLAALTRDDQAVEAALAITNSATTTTDLADALGWDLARVKAALRALEHRQASSGIRLHDHGWQRHALRPATEHLTDEQQQALHRIGPRHRGMTVETASLLADVAASSVGKTWHRNPSAGQRIVLQTLLKQGLVEAHPGEFFAITPTVRFGFYPHDPRIPENSRHRARKLASRPLDNS